MEVTAEPMSEYFEFLDDLRDEGLINMFGARPVLAGAFNLDRKTSADVLAKWQTTFDRTKTLAERVASAVVE